MKWYEKAVLYTALGFTMVKFWEVVSYFKTQINEDKELTQ